MESDVKLWGLWRSTLGGVIIRCPLGQLTVRPPGSRCLFSDRQRRPLFGWRFVFRPLRASN
jgi:hypothetical protein